MDELILSPLAHTWLLDLDGTIVKHNGYKIDGEDSFLPGAERFLQSIPEKDTVIFLTSREEQYREKTLAFLEKNHVRFDHILFEMPYGERILINDRKPSGLNMSLALSPERDGTCRVIIIEDSSL